MPKPIQKPFPVWVSGTLNPAVVGRLSRFGAAWVPWAEDAQNLGASIPTMRNHMEDAGRVPLPSVLSPGSRWCDRTTEEPMRLQRLRTLYAW